MCVEFCNIKSIKSSCEWRREKMLLFICIFWGTLFTPYNFLYILKVVVSEGKRKDSDKGIKNII
ncbi:hypothetical protein Hanom_Chr16g01420001 [Helianthus anomalus]